MNNKSKSHPINKPTGTNIISGEKMIRETLLLFIVVLTGASVYAEDFNKTIFSDDSLIYIESSGEVGGAAIHASNKVTLVYDREDLGKFKTVFSSDKKRPYLPIFTEIRVMGNINDEKVIAFALGWNSFGGGQEKYTGWLIRFDMTPSIVDWFEISLPRTFPGIAYDRKVGEIALLVDKLELETFDRDLNTFCITMLNGKKIGLTEGSTKTEFTGSKKWVLYNNHPFGERKTDNRIDSLLCVKKIIVTKTGFEIIPEKKDGNR